MQTLLIMDKGLTRCEEDGIEVATAYHAKAKASLAKARREAALCRGDEVPTPTGYFFRFEAKRLGVSQQALVDVGGVGWTTAKKVAHGDGDFSKDTAEKLDSVLMAFALAGGDKALATLIVAGAKDDEQVERKALRDELRAFCERHSMTRAQMADVLAIDVHRLGAVIGGDCTRGPLSLLARDKIAEVTRDSQLSTANLRTCVKRLRAWEQYVAPAQAVSA